MLKSLKLMQMPTRKPHGSNQSLNLKRKRIKASSQGNPTALKHVTPLRRKVCRFQDPWKPLQRAMPSLAEMHKMISVVKKHTLTS